MGEHDAIKEWVLDLGKLLRLAAAVEADLDPLEGGGGGGDRELADLFLRVGVRLDVYKVHERWPDALKDDLIQMVSDARAAEAAEKPTRARALLEVVMAQLEARDRRLSSFRITNESYSKTEDRCEEIFAAIRRAFDPEPEALAPLEERFEALQGESEALLERLATGDWDGAEAEAERLYQAMRKLGDEALKLKHGAACVMVLDQGAYTRPDSTTPLLDQVDSGGVCLALTLDWLGAGGSHGEPGDQKPGKITSKHLMGQSFQSVNKALGLVSRDDAEKAGTMGVRDEQMAWAREHQSATAQLEAVREAVAATQGYLRAAQQQRKQQAREVDLIAGHVMAAMRAQKAYRAEQGPGFDPTAPDARRLALNLRFAQQQQALAAKALGRTDATLRSLEVEIGALEAMGSALAARVDELMAKVAGSMEAAAGHVERAQKMLRAYLVKAREWDEAYGRTLHLPSRATAMWGVAPKADTHVVGKAADFDDSVQDERDPMVKYLSSARVRAFFAGLVDGMELGGTASFWLGIETSTGGAHAMGLRVVSGRGEMGEPDIEFLDPNHGGFQHRDLDSFLDFMEAFYADFYAPGWRLLRSREVSVDGTSDPTGTDSLGGRSIAEVWREDLDAADPIYQELLRHPDLPEPTEDLLIELRKAVRRLLPDDPPATATAADHKVAGAKLQRLVETCKSSHQQVHTFQAAKAEALRRIKHDDPDHAGPLKRMGTALRMYEAGELAEAAFEMLEAISLHGFVEAHRSTKVVVGKSF